MFVAHARSALTQSVPREPRGIPRSREVLRDRFFEKNVLGFHSFAISFLPGPKIFFSKKNFNFDQILMIFSHFWANFEEILDLGLK